ncbi:MAG: SUMF1/EgtB/PvdO family nonheme iron enzyme, partial [Chloroflexota bacterium]
DMAGNVWEWTTSSFKRYPYHSDDGRENEEGGQTCVVRGGSFNDSSKYTRVAYRYMNPQPILYYFQGFRVVLSPPVSVVVAKCPSRPLPEGQ